MGSGDEEVRADLRLVDELARLQLEARRLGCSIRLVNPPEDLCRLLELVGLDEVIPAEVIPADDEATP